MRFLNLSLSVCLSIFTLAVAAPDAARAADGRDFAGHYDLTNVVDDGVQVKVTLGLQLYNYSGTDLKGAVVSVRPSHPGDAVGSFPPTQLWRDKTYIML